MYGWTRGKPRGRNNSKVYWRGSREPPESNSQTPIGRSTLTDAMIGAEAEVRDWISSKDVLEAWWVSR